MTEQQILDAITEELCNKHGCHTVILYGSRARGDATEASDYDVLGIRDDGPKFRDARLWQGAYLDLFVVPLSVVENPGVTELNKRNGRVLKEKGDTAQKFFAKLEGIYRKGPEKLPADEISAIVAWHEKALDRIRLGGIQGDLRRAELLPALIEHYFVTRGKWFEGAKAAFLWFQKNRPDLYDAVEKALVPNASVEALEKLVTLINHEIRREAAPAPPVQSQTPDGERPPFIKNWRDLLDADDSSYQDSDELLSYGAPLARKLGLTRIGIHHEIIPPGRRTSWPHAESAEEEFGYVIEGEPDAWINGRLYRLKEGDAVAFPAGTGIAHTFINNTDSNVRMIIVGERTKPDNRIHYPLHPELKTKRKDWWEDAPPQDLGSHDGLPDRLREKQRK